MFLGRPVIAIASGGPRETVVDGKTGFLCSIPTNGEFENELLCPQIAEYMSKWVVLQLIINKISSWILTPSSYYGQFILGSFFSCFRFINDPDLLITMGKQSHEHVRAKFSVKAFRKQFARILEETISSDRDCKKE